VSAAHTHVPHFRTSERRSLKRCPQQWQWTYRQGLTTKSIRPGALWFGIGIHLALQERYKYKGLRRGKDVLKVWRDYVGEEIAFVNTTNYEDADPNVAPEQEWVEAQALGEAMLGAYLDKYGKDERWHVISAEQTFEIPIPRPMSASERRTNSSAQRIARIPLVYYNGTFDLVALDAEAEEENSLLLWDHKTAKQITTSHLSLDDQAGAYWAIASDVLAHQGLIKPGMKLDGILYNFLRKTIPDDRPTNVDGEATNKPTKQQYIAAFPKDVQDWAQDKKTTLADLVRMANEYGIIVLGDVSKTQPTPMFVRETVVRTRNERRTQIQRIQGEALLAEKYRTRELPLIKNPTKDCSWDCSFFSMCELHEAGGDWQEYRDAVYKKTDPYANHRKAAI